MIDRFRLTAAVNAQLVGDRWIRDTTEQEILEIIVSGKRETRLTADEAAAQLAAG